MPSSRTTWEGSDALIRSLIALPELGLRTIWLCEKLSSVPPGRTAAGLDDLVSRAQGGHETARAALLPLALAFVRLRETACLWALREEAKHRAYLNLERMLRDNTDPASVLYEQEPRVPDYGSGRELTVGERRSMARRPTRAQVERLLLDPHPLVLAQLFTCPQLTEPDVLRIVTKRPARLPAIEAVVQSSRWMARRRVRLALVLNPGCPHGVALPLVATCPRDDLKLIVQTTTISASLRTVAHELLQRLPPITHQEPALH